MKVKLTKKCKLYGYYDEFGDNEEYNDYALIEPEDQVELMPALSSYIELEEGFTLRHFFEFIKDYKLDLLHKGFKSFIAYYDKYCKNGILKIDPNYEYLELDRYTIVRRNKVYFQRKLQQKMPKMKFKLKYPTTDFEVDIMDSLSLIMCATEDDINFNQYKKGEPFQASIGMTPLNKIIDLEMRIAPRIYRIEGDRKNYKDWDKHTEEEFMVDDWQLTLIQFIQIVMENITAWGDTIEENEMNSSIMFDRADEVRDSIENKELLKTYKFDDLRPKEGE